MNPSVSKLSEIIALLHDRAKRPLDYPKWKGWVFSLKHFKENVTFIELIGSKFRTMEIIKSYLSKNNPVLN